MPVDFLLTCSPLVKYYIFSLLIFIPVIRVFERAKLNPYFAILLGVPDIGLILCAVVLALKKWPKEA